MFKNILASSLEHICTGIGTIIGPCGRYITSSQCDSTRSREKERALVRQEDLTNYMYKGNKRCASIAQKDGTKPNQMRSESYKNWTFIAMDRDTC